MINKNVMSVTWNNPNAKFFGRSQRQKWKEHIFWYLGLLNEKTEIIDSASA